MSFVANNFVTESFNNSRNNSFSTGPRMKKLKSSLKLSSRTNSISSTSTTSSSSSQKNVRFAPQLTTVKNFCSTDKPSSISYENSPNLIPLDETYSNFMQNDKLGNNFWFNDTNSLPVLFNNKKNNLSGNKTNNSGNNDNTTKFGNFQLDYDSDSGLEDEYDLIRTDSPSLYKDNLKDDTDDVSTLKNINNNNSINNVTEQTESTFDSFDIINWNLLSSNVVNDNNDINILLNGHQNIKLHSIEQVIDSSTNQRSDEIIGLIYVNNLNFEKFIEIKFTFTNWTDIHYVTATYNKSITDKIDEFKFKINLSSFKYFLKLDKLIYANQDSTLPTICPLNIELCCRYDVNNETYYDNNNYKNYELAVLVKTQNLLSASNNLNLFNSHLKRNENKMQKKSFYSDFLVSTTLSHKIHLLNQTNTNSYKISRRFSEDTDYYNTSPLKHLYHNDTTLIKPTNLNKVLSSSDNNNNEEDSTDIIAPPLDPIKPNTSNYYDATAQVSNFQPFTYRSAPSLSSSLSSSLSDISPLNDYTDFIQNDNSNTGSFHCNTNYNLTDSLRDDLSNDNISEVQTQNGTIINNDNDYDDIDPLVIANSNKDFFDDRQSIMTDTAQVIDTNGQPNNQSLFNTDRNFTYFNNNSNETLIIPSKIGVTTMLTSSTPRSETSSTSSSPSSESLLFLSPSTARSSSENKESSNMNSRVTNTIATSSFTGIAETLKPREMDYQTLLNSYCFFTSDNEPTINKSLFEKTITKKNSDNLVDSEGNFDSFASLQKSESPPNTTTSQMMY